MSPRALGWTGLAIGACALPLALFAAPQDGLRPASSFADISNKGERSAAIFTEMGKVLTHPRCVNCHPRTDRPLQGDAGEPHMPAVVRGNKEGTGAPGLECATCHGPANVTLESSAGSVPGHPLWHLAPIEMAWEGKSLRQICEQLKDRRRNGGKSLRELHKHNATDTLVGWGWNPGEGRTSAPGTQAEFGALTKAWIDSGAQCPA